MEGEQLSSALAQRAKVRLRKVLEGWTAIATGPAARRISRARSLLRAMLSARDGCARSFLTRGEVRGWIAASEDALAVARAAARAMGERPRAGRFPASWSRLLDLAANAGILVALAPQGRLPADFPRRARAVALAEIERLCEELALDLLPALPASARRGRWRIRFTADPALGRLAGELPVAATGLSFVRAPGGPSFLELTLGRGGFRAGGERWPYPAPGDGLAGPRVAAVVEARGLELRLVGRSERFEGRVAAALDLLERAWPEAARLVRGGTHLVVPVVEWGTVSYSSPRRPGVSYVHVASRPLARLAEDLLHEAAHGALHQLEEVRPLLARGAADTRFWSPWRKEWRPVRGILHGAFTFAVGAALFARMLRASARGGLGPRVRGARRLWLARRLVEEVDRVRLALVSLRTARRRGLLAPAGGDVVESVARELRRLLPEARRAERWLRKAPGGRRELARLGVRRRELERRPTRWGAGYPPGG